MRFVFDTNVVISALLVTESKPRKAFDAGFQRGTVLLSFSTLAELYEVLSRKQFRKYVDEEDVRMFLAALTRDAEWIHIVTRVSGCRDPKDDKFLELAVNGRATHIVTGDSDLLSLHPFQGISILTPGRFLELRP